MIKFLTVIAIIAVLPGYLYPDETQWDRLPIDIRDAHLTCIAVDPENPDTLYIGTDRHLHKSSDSGSIWSTVFTCSGEERGINDIFISSDSVLYIATKNGLYRSSDFGKDWQRIHAGKTSDKRNIKSVAITDDKKYFYLLLNTGLYEIADNDLSWRKIYPGSNIAEQTNGEEEEFSTDDVIVLKKIALDKKNNLYLSTTKGIFKSSDRGKNWERLNKTGLSNHDINFCLVSKIDGNKVYAATEGGFFGYLSNEKKWKNIYSGLTATKIQYLSFNSKNEDFILCLADNSIYKTAVKKDSLERLYSNFANDPSIRAVQEMAISYAEVHPDKINNWRKGAKLRGLLPKVTFGIDQSASDTYDIYTSGTKSYTLLGPRDYTDGWDLTFTWDLGDLIYNEHQTSIDVRSKLMVQLREDILNEVTRLYFERRRLQIELAGSKPATQTQAIEKELRLQELTASIDAFTGGAFSNAIGAGRR